MTVAIYIQCRLSSSRLPAKALLTLSENTLLGTTIRRMQKTSYPVYILTSDHPDDDVIALEGERNCCTAVYRGDLYDVRSRFLGAAEQFGSQIIVRVTADNPLTDPRIVKMCVDTIISRKLDYVRASPSSCPDGVNVEVFHVGVMKYATSLYDDEHNKEHVTPGIIALAKLKGKLLEVDASCLFPGGASNYHLGVDEISDYVKIHKIFKDYDHESTSSLTVLMADVLEGRYFIKSGRRHEIRD